MTSSIRPPEGQLPDPKKLRTEGATLLGRVGEEDAPLAFALAKDLLYVDPKNPEAAELLLSEILDHYPNWPEARLERAIARIAMGRFSNAITDLDRLEEIVVGVAKSDSCERATLFRLLGRVYLFRAEARTKAKQDAELASVEELLADRVFGWAIHEDIVDGNRWRKEARTRIDQRRGSSMTQRTFILAMFFGALVGVIVWLLGLCAPAAVDSTQSRTLAKPNERPAKIEITIERGMSSPIQP